MVTLRPPIWDFHRILHLEQGTSVFVALATAAVASIRRAHSGRSRDRPWDVLVVQFPTFDQTPDKAPKDFPVGRGWNDALDGIQKRRELEKRNFKKPWSAGCHFHLCGRSGVETPSSFEHYPQPHCLIFWPWRINAMKIIENPFKIKLKRFCHLFTSQKKIRIFSRRKHIIELRLVACVSFKSILPWSGLGAKEQNNPEVETPKKKWGDHWLQVSATTNHHSIVSLCHYVLCCWEAPISTVAVMMKKTVAPDGGGAAVARNCCCEWSARVVESSHPEPSSSECCKWHWKHLKWYICTILFLNPFDLIIFINFLGTWQVFEI